MKIKEIIKMGLKNLLYRIRSGLILFSITIGSCALFLVFSINEAGKNEILKIIKEKGNASIVEFYMDVFTNKRVGLGERPADYPVGDLSETDMQLLKNSCPEIDKIACLGVEYVQQIKVRNREEPPDGASHIVVPHIEGITPQYKEIIALKLKEGRFINNTDMHYKRKVCVIGETLYERLGKGKIIGEKLIIKDTQDKFTIVGLLKKRMPLFTSLPDKIKIELIANKTDFKSGRKTDAEGINDVIYIPLPTWKDVAENVVQERMKRAPKWLFFLPSESNMSASPPKSMPRSFFIKINIPEGGKLVEDEENTKIYTREFGLDYIPEKVKLVVDKMRKILRKKYGEDKLFAAWYRGKLTDEIQDQIGDSNKLLWTTGLFTLLLSGVILSSMMLMSVHNRVSEIGIRRAFGARKKDIFYQFIGEGIAIYSIGIVIGLFTGLVLSYLLIVKVLTWEYSISVYSLVISSVIPFLVGIMSSVYPAMKAANVPPAVAVKYE